jgi:glycosyltransferase involved in cell wall biosynthesis
MPSVVIPAHNEAAVIGRLLGALLAHARPAEFDVVVVANGCTDDTAQVAQAFGPSVRAVSAPEPSKHKALRLGDELAQGFPRLYVDADVSLGTADARALVEALGSGLLAVAPQRVMDLSSSSLIVRWYYDIWQLLPTVERGLYGRGVIAVSAAGFQRLASAPEVMADDLAASLAFNEGESAIVPEARVVVAAPRTVGDLIRRRVRAATSIAQMHQHVPDAVDANRTSRGDLVRIVRNRPLRAPKLAVFLAVTVIARRRARAAIRAGDFSTWLRDESSRTGGSVPKPANAGRGAGRD